MKSNHIMNFYILNWSVCSKCGLISLKNKKTLKALRKACPGTDIE